MTTNPSVDNQAKGQVAAVPAPDFAAQMHVFWQKNRSFIYLLFVVVLLAFLGREGWDYFTAKREQSIQEEYARAVTSPDKLTSFAAEYSSHPLAGVAWLTLADRQFATGDFKSAISSYQRAAGTLPDVALKSRARLGSAMSLLASGDQSGGETALKPLVDDATAEKVIRVEACYHLATLANDANRADDVRKYATEAAKIDPMSLWTQRAFALEAALPAQAKPGAPTLSLTPGK
jgi:predicted negative regulator of RcsB-dependent stress response